MKNISRHLKIFCSAGLLALLLISNNQIVSAQAVSPVTYTGENLEDLEAIPEATAEAEASESSKLASPSAEVVEKIQKKTDEDITETSGKQKSVLAAYLDEHPIGKLTFSNPLQKAIRKAVANGLPANIIVILLIFPLVASLIAFSRHVVGLKGFGIYIPAVLSVAFVSTGLVTGIILFLAVLLSSIAARKVVRKFKLPVLPKTAMLLLAVTSAMLALLIVGSVFNIDLVLNVSIFPLLIIILLTENFMTTQLFSSQGEALSVTFETLIIAVICSVLVGSESLQKFVILRPELTLIVVALINLAIGRYNGLRIFEYFRFKELLKDKTGVSSFKGFPSEDVPEGEEEE